MAAAAAAAGMAVAEVEAAAGADKIPAAAAFAAALATALAERRRGVTREPSTSGVKLTRLCSLSTPAKLLSAGGGAVMCRDPPFNNFSISGVLLTNSALGEASAE